MPYSLKPYQDALQAPEARKQMLSNGWFTADTQHPPAGLFAMAIALDELTGQVLKGVAAYDPEARWVHTNLDTGEPRAVPGNGWVFLDLTTGACYVDKLVFYFKPFSPKAKNRPTYPWVQIYTT